MQERAEQLTQKFLLSMTLVALLFSWYMQYVQGLAPCSLCTMQRVCVYALLALAMLVIVVRGRHVRLGVLLQLLFALLGLYFALRQLWLQSLPAQLEAVCLPGLELLAHYLPWRDFVQLLFWGSPACNEVLWQAWGFSMAAWAALYFSVMVSGLMWLLFHLPVSRKK